MQKIVFASGNRGKVREVNQILDGLDFEVVAQTELGVTDIPETGLTFVENAILKARNAAEQTGLPALADDSGLVVDALGGAPGIYSARFAGEGADDAKNNELLLQQMQGVENRQAHFHSTIVFMRSGADPAPIICDGQWHGEISDSPQGENGFGYDPLFWVGANGCSAAQLSSEDKNRMSHRGAALRRLLLALKEAI